MRTYTAMRPLLLLIVMLSWVMPYSADAATISGFLTDEAGRPVANTDLDVFVAATGVKLITPGDNTDARGFYSISVLPGIYNVGYDSPVGSRLLGKRVYNVTVPAAGLELNVVLSSGTVISGQINNSLNQPVDSVNIDVDSVGGGRLYTSNDLSDAAGAYSIAVPNGAYRLRFSPLAGSRLRGSQFDTVLISRDTVIDLVLVDGHLFRGKVTDAATQGIPQVTVDLRDQVTGAKIFLAGDKTTADGSFSVAAPTGLYVLRFAPPAGSRFVAVKVDSVQISADRTWNETLPTGVLATVVTQDSVGTPIVGVNVDFKLPSAGVKLYTPFDKTDGQGRVIAALLPNQYAIQLDPPLTTPFALVKLDSVNIATDTIIVVTMREQPRIILSGRISLAARSPLGVKIDLKSVTTGIKAVLSNNQADSAGFFSFPAPKGNYDLFLGPPRGSRVVARFLPSLNLTSDTSLGEILMNVGSLVRIVVQNDAHQPLPGVDCDFIDEATLDTAYTPFGRTDSLGEGVAALYGGVYTVRVNPLVGSGYEPAAYNAVIISADTTIQFTLHAGSASIQPFILNQNYPNPFGTQTTIDYAITRASDISVTVYNILGELVVTLANGHHEPNNYRVTWDGRTGQGRDAGSGPYFVRLKSGDSSDSKKMLIVK